MTKSKPNLSDSTIVTSVGKIEETGEKKACILFLSGPLFGKLHSLKEGTTNIGRAEDAELTINDTRISRHHVSINVTHEKIVITDLGSTNGTYVNGKKVQTAELRDGDKVQLSSSTIFKFAHQDTHESVFHNEFYKMAILDAATGIFNKRYFLDRLDEEFSHSKRGEHPLSLLMIDIDFFKTINDTHGHLAGDIALGHLAQTIKKMIRTGDVFARYGGEEFALLLRNADEKGAWQLAERIRQTVAQNMLPFEGESIAMTISIGVASIEDESIESPKMLIDHADQNLYHSKKEGRNRTTSKNFKTT